MVNSKTLLKDFMLRLRIPEGRSEMEAVATLVFEKVLGLSRADLLREKPVSIARKDQATLEEILTRLNTGEPVQYVLGEAYFFGRRFLVNPGVLIPRPETEELVREVIRWCKEEATRTVTILDVGTGSGCIAISLALELGNAIVHATDVDQLALRTAEENAQLLGAAVHFHQHDILESDLSIQGLDVVVSNPPYVTEDEKKRMKENVVNHEPHLALFAPGKDPLVFYKAVARKSLAALEPSGLVAVEINETLGDETRNVFVSAGFDAVNLQQDMSGKNRIVTARKPQN